MDLIIQKTTNFETIWPIFREIVKNEDTYVFPKDINKNDASSIWINQNTHCYIAKSGLKTVGTYIIKANHIGLGSHIANASFMVDPAEHGKGVGRAMGTHAIAEAKALGFKGMQFNIVVSSNIGAIRLWESLGFKVIGTIPNAFRLKGREFVDALVMFLWF